MSKKDSRENIVMIDDCGLNFCEHNPDKYPYETAVSSDGKVLRFEYSSDGDLLYISLWENGVYKECGDSVGLHQLLRTLHVPWTDIKRIYQQEYEAAILALTASEIRAIKDRQDAREDGTA